MGSAQEVQRKVGSEETSRQALGPSTGRLGFAQEFGGGLRSGDLQVEDTKPGSKPAFTVCSGLVINKSEPDNLSL